MKYFRPHLNQFSPSSFWPSLHLEKRHQLERDKNISDQQIFHAHGKSFYIPLQLRSHRHPKQPSDYGFFCNWKSTGYGRKLLKNLCLKKKKKSEDFYTKRDVHQKKRKLTLSAWAKAFIKSTIWSSVTFEWKNIVTEYSLLSIFFILQTLLLLLCSGLGFSYSLSVPTHHPLEPS